jgi:hypothetical protein
LQVWQKRYFELEDEVLKYYKEKGQKPVGAVPLEGITLVALLSDKKGGLV